MRLALFLAVVMPLVTIAATRETGFLNRTVTETTFADTTMEHGISYRYAVASVDKNGNQSAQVWTEWVVVPKTP